MHFMSWTLNFWSMIGLSMIKTRGVLLTSALTKNIFFFAALVHLLGQLEPPGSLNLGGFFCSMPEIDKSG